MAWPDEICTPYLRGTTPRAKEMSFRHAPDQGVDSIFQQRILAPLKMLQSSLEDPLYLVLKRDDKRLDYDHVSKKMNSLRDHSKTRQIAEEYESTKLDFEALNKQLIEDIPKICSVSGKILDQVLGLLVESRKVFYSKILISLLPLADLPLIRSEHDSILTGFTLKHNLATNHLATLAPSLVPPTWRKKRSSSDAAPVAPASPVVNRGLLRRSTRSNRRQPSAGDSSPKVNARRISHPPMSTTIQPRSSSPFPANMGEPYVVIRTVDPPEDKGAMGSLELPVTQGQSVRVIKKEDPCGNPDRWLIHDGVQMGFVSRDILTPAPSPGSGITPASTVSSSTASTVPPAIPSRPAPQPRLSKQISGGESAPPPSYDEIMGADDAHEATAQTPTDSAGAAGGSEDTSRQTERVHLLALFSYEAKTDHELSLEEGEALRIIRRGDDTGNTEWTMVQREREPRDKGFIRRSGDDEDEWDHL
ncbi:unnamed protein product [Cyprideis torosa]|uniref:Uncharacterized protein n=1 Tax=Cyprideis torosa TaxID=163714 RepID=A0A7R8WDP6_9CRUS|nr:unnamed protein product [Cyprideis torosa]CAG0889791.1 unnamed protein product [Cyprideis torosa]